MCDRLERKKLPPLNFSKVQFRSHLLSALGGKEDGFIQCRYCRGFFTVADVAVDHEMPLIRNGSSGLENIGYPCSACNQMKESMTPGEFLELLDFLEKRIPLARKSVLSRLQKAVALAAGARADMAIKGDLKKSGAWGQAQADRRARKKAKESGLSSF